MAPMVRRFLDEHDVGSVLGADATLRLAPGLVRWPDVSFVSWAHFPDLAVEVLSKGNTGAEMRRKLGEYFWAGCRLVWYVVPDERAVRVYASPTSMRELGEDDTIDGGAVLPGFRLALREWFDRAGPRR
jgi:Uma2 family endonuclease